MNIFKSSIAVTRFKVSDIPEVDGKDPVEAMMDALELNQIVEIETGEDISWGWTSLLDPFSPKFSDMSFLTGDYVTVSLAINKKSIPAATLKRDIYLAEKAEMKSKQIPKLARATKVIIKESVTKNLLKSVPTIPISCDVVWNIQKQELFLFSTNKMVKELLEELIFDTFGLQIRMVFPFTMGLNDVREDVLSTIQPTIFA
jgi:DNA recombination-dependent growth factor C